MPSDTANGVLSNWMSSNPIQPSTRGMPLPPSRVIQAYVRIRKLVQNGTTTSATRTSFHVPRTFRASVYATGKATSAQMTVLSAARPSVLTSGVNRVGSAAYCSNVKPGAYPPFGDRSPTDMTASTTSGAMRNSRYQRAAGRASRAAGPRRPARRPDLPAHRCHSSAPQADALMRAQASARSGLLYVALTAYSSFASESADG